MKKYILVILSVMLILNFTSCTKKDLPDNITIEGKEYQRAFIGELYPLFFHQPYLLE